MDSILIVEPSSTLQYVLRRGFARLSTAQQISPSYHEAMRRLRSADQSFRAVVVGIPVGNDSVADELLALLSEPERRDIAVVLMMHVADRQRLEWVANRPSSTWLLWENHSECGQRMEQLLSSPRPSLTDNVGATAHVLLVDDARTVRETFRRLLERHGYEVEVAVNMDDALVKASEHSFDIAIVDYFMPGGNGDELCRRLRADPRTASITTAILTATYVEEVIRHSLDAGAVECMFKDEAAELFLARLAAMSRSVHIKKSIEAERIRLGGILSSVGDGVYGVSREGRITFINPVACRLLGHADLDTLIGMPAHQLFHYMNEDGTPNPIERCRLQQAYTVGGELRDWETVFWRRAGTSLPVECTVSPLRIGERYEGSVIAFRDVSERRLLQRELTWQANHDSLTKLPNRNYFVRALEDEINRLVRSQEHSALLYLDLDRFKYINDTGGHAAGDALLIEISQQLRARLRESDILARLGGDEFVILLRNVHPDFVLMAAEGFREVLAGYRFMFAGQHYVVHGSLGVAMLGRDAGSPGAVLANADLACHIAKGKGRNQTHVYHADADATAGAHLDLGWSARLQDALKNNGFVLHFQPIIPVAHLGDTGAPHNLSMNDTHHEVLVRLNDAKGGVIYPGSFLPTAERFNLMRQIDTWVITAALQSLAALQAAGRERATFSINLSVHALDPELLVSEVRRLLTQYQVDPCALVFEITESEALANLNAVNRLIHQLHDLGCRLALDDFGAGFSSFHHLKHLAVDFVKIDGQFIQGMASDRIDRAIVASINEVAHSFGKRTIAESVEDPQVLELLRGLGVDYVQGYYLARPDAGLMGDGQSIKFN
jgi:diguanylate cyclase (GGDEF)-like protein/PAS domain S-box-containing protein